MRRALCLCVCVCVCVCVHKRVHKSVRDKGGPLLISNHFTQVSPVHIGWQQWRLTVLGLYTPWSLLPPWSSLGGQHAVSGPDINSGPGAACALGGRLSRNLFAIMEVTGKCMSNATMRKSYASRYLLHLIPLKMKHNHPV